MHAVRNIKLCTKDCLCLYVCPTGATDTETGQIDKDMCVDGCRICVDACPSHAISLIPDTYPKQQEKNDEVKKALGIISKSKTVQENIGKNIINESTDPIMKQFGKALELSNRIMAEDILRESGFMLPQSEVVVELLNKLLKDAPSDFPKKEVEEIITFCNK